jgi:hypothetical protein
VSTGKTSRGPLLGPIKLHVPALLACMFFLFFSSLIRPRHRRAFVSLQAAPKGVSAHWACWLIRLSARSCSMPYHLGALNFKPLSIVLLLTQLQSYADNTATDCTYMQQTNCKQPASTLQLCKKLFFVMKR